MAPKKYAALKDWQHRQCIDVELDKGFTVKLKLPDIGAYLAKGKIPNPLRAIAEKIEYDDVVDLQKATDEDRAAFYDLQAHILATHIVEPNVVAECGDVEKAEAWVLENIPPADRALLWARALHILDHSTQEVLRSLIDLEQFRSERSGAGAGGSSEADAQGA
jgi:hypothetical protein